MGLGTDFSPGLNPRADGKAPYSALTVFFTVVWLSGLTKKSVYADWVLAIILGVREGEHVSYADISRGLHKYIKDHDLKNPQAVSSEVSPPPAAGAPPSVLTEKAGSISAMRKCRECGAEIPAEAIFCDVCGMRQ